MVELKDFKAELELLHTSELLLHSLNPEIPNERALGHASDIISLEAFNPDDMSHDAMKPKALEGFLKGDDRHITRFLQVHPTEFYSHVDRKVFDEAQMDARKAGNWEMVKAYDEMRKGGVLGFVYLSNDEYKGGDDKYRAIKAREVVGLAKDMPVWELNTGFVPGAKDKGVKFAVQQTLNEFIHGLQGDAAGVYFADAHDIKDSLKTLTEASLRTIASDPNLLKQADYQDTRVLSKLGFTMVGQMQYEPGTGWKDFVYAIMFHGSAGK